MANFIPSPNMNLPVPVVGVDPGPDYANNIDTCFTLLDQHNHSSGSGVPINPTGININASLPFNSNAATFLGYLGFAPQGSGVATPVNYSLYVQPSSVSAHGDLYYQDGNGETVQITLGGLINATSSGISSGTASASFISSVLVVTQATSVAAPIDAASYILRYNGSYPSPSGNAIVLAAPSSLSGTYQFTLPPATPGLTNALITSDTSGVIGYTNADSSTLAISGGAIFVRDGGIINSKIGVGAVAQTNMAANSVGTAQIINSNITSNKIGTNIDLPGNRVTENARPVIVGNTATTTSLCIVRGDSQGRGEGYSISGSAGSYTITFTTPFSDNPVVVGSAISAANPAASVGTIFTANTITTSSATINLVSYAGGNTAGNFSFIAIGQR